MSLQQSHADKDAKHPRHHARSRDIKRLHLPFGTFVYFYRYPKRRGSQNKQKEQFGHIVWIHVPFTLGFCREQRKLKREADLVTELNEATTEGLKDRWFVASSSSCFKTVDSQSWQPRRPIDTNSCWSLEVMVITCELWERQGLVVMPTWICNYLHTICKLYIRTSSYINLSHLVLCSVVLIACSVLCLSLFVQDFNVWLHEGLCLSVLFSTFLLSPCSGLGHSRSRTRSHGRSCRASLATKMFCWNLSGHEQNLRLLFHVLDALNFWSEPEPWTDLYTSTQHCIIQQWPPHFFQLGRRLIHRI